MKIYNPKFFNMHDTHIQKFIFQTTITLVISLLTVYFNMAYINFNVHIYISASWFWMLLSWEYIYSMFLIWSDPAWDGYRSKPWFACMWRWWPKNDVWFYYYYFLQSVWCHKLVCIACIYFLRTENTEQFLDQFSLSILQVPFSIDGIIFFFFFFKLLNFLFFAALWAAAVGRHLCMNDIFFSIPPCHQLYKGNFLLKSFHYIDLHSWNKLNLHL